MNRRRKALLAAVAAAVVMLGFRVLPIILLISRGAPFGDVIDTLVINFGAVTLFGLFAYKVFERM